MDKSTTYGSLALTIYPTPNLISVSPAAITASNKEIVFSIKTDSSGGFVNTANLTCSLSNHLSLMTMYRSSKEILCMASGLNAGKYYVNVSNNNIDFIVNQNLIITAYDTPVVLWAQPNVIPKNASYILVGGTSMFYSSTLSCFFDPVEADKEIQQQYITNAIYLSFNSILCPAPKFDSVKNGMQFNLRVSFFNNEWSVTSALITVMQYPPQGFYFAYNVIYSCPAGSYCPLEDTTSPHLCPSGTYQPNIESGKCILCPEGFICPFSGMISPISCPVGHFCNAKGSRMQKCPKGYFCPGGVSRDSLFGVDISLEPQICEKGTYCDGRTATGVLLRNVGVASKICKQGFVCNRGSSTQYGIGGCPAGHYCPTPEHAGIPCPPRYFCPTVRAHVQPIPCPAGTFNYHYGQTNCTSCPIGYICPISGMLLPMKCPRGYICNKENLVQAMRVCTAGYICQGGIKSASTSPPAVPLFDGYVSTDCPTGRILSTSTDLITLAAGFDSSFSSALAICAMNKTEIQAIINSIDSSYSRYADLFYQNSITGIEVLNFLASYPAQKKFSEVYPTIIIPSLPEKKIKLFFTNRFRNPKQLICPGGYFCLSGVTTTTVNLLTTTPYPCPSGAFCSPGSSSVVGTAYCPSGYYCPLKTRTPVLTAPGYFTSRIGATDQIKCYPGYYTIREGSSSCSTCPSGYECKDAGTAWPNICQAGTYRATNGSNVCVPCPEGK